MRQTWGTGVAVVCGLLALPSASKAENPPHDEGIDVQLFQLAIGPKTFLTVDNGDTTTKGGLTFDALLTYLTNPFTVYNSSGPSNTMTTGERAKIVNNMTAAQLTAAYGVTEKIQVGANLPVVFSLAGNTIDPAMGTPNGSLQVTGLGDLLLEGKLRVYEENQLHVALIGGLTLPTMYVSNGAKFTGDKLPTVRARAAAQWTSGQISLGADLGLLLRDPQEFYGTTVGQQMLWGGGAAYAVTPRFSVVAETYGRFGLQGFSLNNSPAEAVAGLRVGVSDSYAVVVGGGGGLDQAIGAPGVRAFASLSYVPGAFKLAQPGSGPALDTEHDHDHDGIPDKDDKCPNEAEDHDGFEDDDGCPDLDNDKDGIPDLQDKCPNDPEDGKEPYPKDGCPASKRDSDGDGIPDSIDQCPLEEEDFDGFEDSDGCPDLDNDHDGIPDAQDKCPLCPEDKDGFEDADGCPDPDNDKDGIPDALDACPNEPETINGVKDDDGCPDTGGVTLVHLEDDRLTIDRVPALDKTGLAAAGKAVADQMALVLLGHREVTKWLIAVSQKDAKDAQRIGDALKEYLGKKGVHNVDVLAAAGPPKIGAVVQERADASAAYCPLELQVKPRPELSAPAKAPANASTPATTPPAAAPAAPATAPAPAAPPAPAAKPADTKPAASAAPAAPAKPATPAKPAEKKPEPKKQDAPEIDLDH
jgi:hypothetical protein